MLLCGEHWNLLLLTGRNHWWHKIVQSVLVLAVSHEITLYVCFYFKLRNRVVWRSITLLNFFGRWSLDDGGESVVSTINGCMSRICLLSRRSVTCSGHCHSFLAHKVHSGCFDWALPHWGANICGILLVLINIISIVRLYWMSSQRRSGLGWAYSLIHHYK